MLTHKKNKQTKKDYLLTCLFLKMNIAYVKDNGTLKLVLKEF